MTDPFDWAIATALVIAAIAAAICAIVLTVNLTDDNGPRQSCLAHQGVQSVEREDGVIRAYVCRDGQVIDRG